MKEVWVEIHLLARLGSRKTSAHKRARFSVGFHADSALRVPKRLSNIPDPSSRFSRVIMERHSSSVVSPPPQC